MKSMTGYGSLEGQLDGVSYTVEIKSVNNRYFKTRVKLPDQVAFLEDDIDKLLRQNLSRGMVSYTLRFRCDSTNALLNIDQSVLKIYMEKLDQVAKSTGVKYSMEIGNLLTLPGILNSSLPDKEKSESIRKEILSITQESIEKLKQMRAKEGSILAVEIEKYCKGISDNLEKIRSRQKVVPGEYKDKLTRRIDMLLEDVNLKLDQEVLARETAIFADRSDISEEITRLDSHLQQLVDVCHAEGQAGRRLDFLAQEMLRESNTIASKSLDTEIIHRVVDMKCQIDRIKEQVQNIE